ncbi:MAG: LysM peptidoglycan-binding domain-containing protein [Actinomycetota bacterium]
MKIKSHQLPSLRLLILLTALIAVFLLISGRVDASRPAFEYVVRPGDTVWELAGRVAESGEDIRTVVSAINEINGLSGGLIRPGQVLSLPTG